jgi:phosphatidylserine decarboxylase
MSSLFVYMMFTPAGEAAFRNENFNDAIRYILQDWCDFLDSPESQYVLNTGEFGWLSPSAYAYNKLDEFVIPDRDAPHWGFESFNDYFHRQVKPDLRPVAQPNNPKVIVSANDGTVWDIQRNVKYSDTFWIKSQPYSLVDILAHHPLTDQFVGGDVFQSFLSGANYHRWRAPISGTVIYAEVIDGLMFSELHSLGFDSNAGTMSQGYETAVNTRGLVIIQSPDPVVGMVCVIPVGITEISSVTIQVEVGQTVDKGEELGYFSYGGSTLALVFQPGAIKKFLYPSPPPPDHNGGATILVNSQIAEAN